MNDHELEQWIKEIAPDAGDSRAAAKRVRAKLPKRRGRVLHLIPAYAAAAAVVVLTVLVVAWPREQRTNPDSTVAPRPEVITTQDAPAFQARVRRSDAQGWVLDAGASDGVRVGDQFRTSDGVLTVRRVAVFESYVEGAKTRVGATVWMDTLTPAIERSQNYSEFGGDPGGFYVFGAVIEPAPVATARALGISNGQALHVVETLGTLWSKDGVEPTLASRLGLTTGDIIVSVNGVNVKTLADFAQALDWTGRVTSPNVRVIRNQRQVTLGAESK